MKIYVISGIGAVTLLYLHIIGQQGLYITYPWWDIMMHILGGLTLGLLAYQIAKTHIPVNRFSLKRIVFAVFLVGVAWEIFEAIYNIAGSPVGTAAYYIDTAKDLLDDIIGAVLAVNLITYFEKFNYLKSFAKQRHKK